MNNLDDYNAWFLSKCKKYLKDLNYLLKDETWEGNNYFIIEIENPFQPDRNIKLSCFGSELTLYFGKYHSHYDQFEDDNHSEEFKSVVEEIQRIMNDEVIIAEYYNQKGHLTQTAALSDISSIRTSRKEKILIYNWSGRINEII